MKRLVILLFLVTAGLAVSAQGPVHKDVEGTWEGQVNEPGRSGDYHVSITLSSDGDCTIYYSDYGCGGTLELISITKEGQHIFREHLTEGLDACIDDGIVSVLRNGSQLAFVWQHEDYDHNAQGMLERQ